MALSSAGHLSVFGDLSANGNFSNGGNISTLGNLTVSGTKSFVQDHPTDPNEADRLCLIRRGRGRHGMCVGRDS
ncbi:hypothetical protein HYR54_04545 [Candidatus Acetothermia bacterium]|nr:hypothetical protein [Candidatus Acetothermia bacterium]